LITIELAFIHEFVIDIRNAKAFKVINNYSIEMLNYMFEYYLSR